MVARPIYHRTRPYSERELYQAVVTYLEDNFIFRRLEIDQWLGNDKIIFREKDDALIEKLTSGKSAEELWYDGVFEDWATHSKKTTHDLFSEFFFTNTQTVGKNRKRLVTQIIRDEIEQGALTETIKFSPVLKKIIGIGRQKEKGVRPLPFGSHKRRNIELNEGDVCYFSWQTTSPYVANPAFVFKKHQHSYSIIFFSNLHNGSETSKLEINMVRFITPQANELGVTPEQAILQHY